MAQPKESLGTTPAGMPMHFKLDRLKKTILAFAMDLRRQTPAALGSFVVLRGGTVVCVEAPAAVPDAAPDAVPDAAPAVPANTYMSAGDNGILRQIRGSPLFAGEIRQACAELAKGPMWPRQGVATRMANGLWKTVHTPGQVFHLDRPEEGGLADEGHIAFGGLMSALDRMHPEVAAVIACGGIVWHYIGGDHPWEIDWCDTAP